ncbi:potassium transporter TrkA [Alteromonas sp. KUL156]|nr:potassium transporter TrkA [Tenacibaculum sp. KUL118]GFD96131.1 potassium transporter TrkA [Alteromonas sp. KUL154]GFE02667.1 potassium transporter TrkA [Alteromonas sp. KUL156]
MSHFSVIGLGKFGLTASLELIHMGHTVTGIDKSEKLVEQYAGEFTQCIVCDASDERALKELNLCQSEAVLVAIGEDMQASLLCTLALKNLGVANIWVKANSSAHHAILSKLGVSKIIHPEEEMGARVAQALNYPMVNDYLGIGHGMYIVDVILSDQFSSLSLKDVLSVGKGQVSCLLVKRGHQLYHNPSEDFEVTSNDTVILCGHRDSLVKIAPRLAQ